MIGRLQGILLAKDEGEVLLDVGGVGYEVEVPVSTWTQLPDRGDAVVLFTHFVVRDDAQHLYGFCELQDRTLFRLLIKVNGVGPKLALGILSGMATAQFVACVARNDVNALVKLPGVGRKTAERLVIEMRDRLKGWELMGTASVATALATAAAPDVLQEAEAALLSLGYRPQEASRAVMAAVSQLEQGAIEPATETIIRAALKQLGKG
ncbi:MAG: Holliday junction branch migration protein RuvA [Pseudohongiellaceae bacterium]